MTLAAAQAWLDTALQAMARRDHPVALQHLQAALELAPDQAALHTNLALVLEDTGDPGAAMEHLSMALELEPDRAEVHLNLGVLAARTGALALAETALRYASRLDPSLTAAWATLGSLLDNTHRGTEAETCLRHALTLSPPHAGARFNLACLLLREQRYHEAWPLWEMRDWSVLRALPWPCPRWHGDCLRGRRVLVIQDAGIGDLMQCARYLGALQSRGACRIDVVCHASLGPLLAQLPQVHTVWSWDNSPRALADATWDFWVPAMSLPACLDAGPPTGASFSPYLLPPAAALLDRALPLPKAEPAHGLRVCLVLQGNPDFPHDAHRSIHDRAALTRLQSVPGLDWFVLQGSTVTRGLGNGTAQWTLSDWMDTACLLDQLDLVISVDTAVAHLAGAMGVPCWLLLPDYLCDWRWQRQGRRTPWYPSLELFRQTSPGDWAGVVDRVADALQAPGVALAIQSLRRPQTSA